MLNQWGQLLWCGYNVTKKASGMRWGRCFPWERLLEPHHLCQARLEPDDWSHDQLPHLSLVFALEELRFAYNYPLRSFNWQWFISDSIMMNADGRWLFTFLYKYDNIWQEIKYFMNAIPDATNLYVFEEFLNVFEEKQPEEVTLWTMSFSLKWVCDWKRAWLWLRANICCSATIMATRCCSWAR